MQTPLVRNGEKRLLQKPECLSLVGGGRVSQEAGRGCGATLRALYPLRVAVHVLVCPLHMCTRVQTRTRSDTERASPTPRFSVPPESLLTCTVALPLPVSHPHPLRGPRRNSFLPQQLGRRGCGVWGVWTPWVTCGLGESQGPQRRRTVDRLLPGACRDAPRGGHCSPHRRPL